MHVLLMISSVAMGGTERNIVSSLPYLLEAGLDVSLCTQNTRRDSPLVDSLDKRVTRFDLEARRMVEPAAWKRFAQLIREKDFDIIHGQDQDMIVYAGLANRRLGIPAIMSRHVLVEPTSTTKEFIRAQMVLMAARFSFNKIITVSEAVRQDFAKRAHVPLSKIETIYNGLELEKFNTEDQREAKRAEMGWQSDDKIVIMVAVLRPGKGHEVLFEAMPQLIAAVPNIKIKMVGDGELADSFKEMYAPYSDSVEFLGQRIDIPELLGASDMLILPSWSEALPTVLLEAGAAALPVVATDVGGTKEIVEDKQTGYVVPAGDADQLAEFTIQLMNNPEEARAMGQRARERITKTFSLEKQAQELKQLYERVLADA